MAVGDTSTVRISSNKHPRSNTRPSPDERPTTKAPTSPLPLLSHHTFSNKLVGMQKNTCLYCKYINKFWNERIS